MGYQPNFGLYCFRIEKIGLYCFRYTKIGLYCFRIAKIDFKNSSLKQIPRITKHESLR